MAFVIGPGRNPDEEVWRDVVGYEGRYLVSSLGRIKSLVSRRPGSIRKLEYRADGYVQVNLWKDGVQKQRQIHILVDLAFNGPRVEWLEVNHKDGIKSNPALSNLERVTRSENALHAFSLGLRTVVRGSDHCQAVLTDEIVTAMRKEAGPLRTNGRFRHGVVKKLALQYGVSRQHVAAVLRQRRWSHI